MSAPLLSLKTTELITAQAEKGEATAMRPSSSEMTAISRTPKPTPPPEKK